MRRRIKWIAISLGVGICLLASAYLSRDVLIAPRVAALIQAALSRELGMQVAIGRLGGSLLSDIEIEDLQTVIPGSQGPVSSLTVKRLHIRYGLFELLSGPAAFVGGMGIEADGLQAELDLDRGDPSSSEASPSAFFPLTLPAVQVRDGAVAIRRGELRTRFDGITLDIAKSAAAARRIRLAVAAWSWSHPFLAAGESILAADLTLAPDSIDIRELSLDGGRIAAVGRLGLTGPADPFPFEARLKLGETWLSLAGDFSSSVLNLKLKTDPVEIEPIAALFRQPMSGRLSADIDLSVPFDRPEAVSGRLQLDVLNARINGVALATAGVAAGVADGWVRVADLKAASGHSRLKLTDAAAPLNHLLDGAWGDLLRELSGRFALSSEDLPELFQLIGLSTEPAPERVPEHRLELSGRLDGGYVHIPHAGLSSGSNRIQIQDLETRLHPAPADTPLKGRLRANLPDLEALSRLFPLVSTSGSVQADATIGGTFGRPEADAVVAAENLKLGGQDVGSVSLKVHCERQQAQVKTLAVRRGADTLDGTASIRLPAGYIDAAELAFTVADLEGLGRQFFPAGWTIGGERPRVQGRARGQVNLSGHWNSPDGELAAIFEDLRLNDSRFGTGSVRMLKRGGTVTANPVRLEQGDDRLELQGSWDFAAGRLAAVRLRIDWAEAGAYLGAFASPWNGVSGRLRAMVDASGPVHRPDFALDLFLERIPAGSGSLAETHIMARGAGRRIDIETAETVTPIGRLRAAGSFAQSSAGAVWDATIDAFRLDGEQLQLTMTQPARIRYEAGRGFWIDAFEWTGPEGHRVAIAGALPVDPAGDPVLAPGALALTATVDIPSQDLLRQLVPAWPIAAGAIEARLALEGSWAAPRGALQLAGRDMTLAADSIYAPPGPYAARIEMAVDARRILLQTIEVHSAHARFQGAGSWQDYPAFNQWTSGKPPPAGIVALEGRLAAHDLGWLARGVKDIRRVTGRLDADLKIEGPLRDPRLQGSLRLSDGELRPEADLPPLQALSLDAGFAGRDLTIRSLRGELGGAPFEVTGSVANLLAADSRPAVDLRLAGRNLLLQRSPTLRLRADTDLRLTGPLERMALAGSLSITDGLFAKNFGLAEGLTAGSAKPKAGPGFSLFSFDSAPLRDLRFDVRVNAAKPFQIKNNLVKGAFWPDLGLVGTGEAPELVGKVYLEATRLYLPAGRMQFDSGVIHFEAVEPGRPRLDMVGTARMIGYDITAVVGGPYDEPSVSLSSVPPLPDADLLALVLTGQPPKTPGGDSVEKRQGLNVAVFIGRDVLMRMPGGDSAESLQAVLERLDVELGRSVTRAGDETINARFRIADGVLRQGDTLYLTGEKDVFDQYNAGVRIVFRFR